MPPTTPILFPSGEDANPLHKRLPAEVVTRRRREVKKVEEKPLDEVHVDLKAALAWKPEARYKWFEKACKMAEEGRASTTELFNIISNRKFLAGIPSKVVRKLRDIVQDNLGLFSEKQQRHLRSDECELNEGSLEKAGKDADGDDRELDGAAQTEAVAQRSKEAASLPERRQGSEKAGPEEGRAAKVGQAEDYDEWTATPAARGQEERLRREAKATEDRARRKALERKEQERWMAAEAERAQEQQRARKRQLEDEVDSSMLLLERLGQQRQQEQLALVPVGGESRSWKSRSKSRSRSRRRGEKKQRGLSRSRSISMRPAKRRGRSASRSCGRRRRRSNSGGNNKDRAASFADALKRRMAEREANDTTRIPVVDPGHAQRSWR